MLHLLVKLLVVTLGIALSLIGANVGEEDIDALCKRPNLLATLPDV